jgi:lysozyme
MELKDFVGKFEGFSSSAYQCSAGVWTIGYGSTFNPYTKVKVKPLDKITKAEALDWLKQELNVLTESVKSIVKVPLTVGQLNALVSFTYNVGIGNLRKSTLLRLLNAGDYKGAANQFLLWNKAGGKVLRGLTIRRQAEKDLFLS